MIRILPENESAALRTRKTDRIEQAEALVRPIIEAVRREGDAALRRFARRFDGIERDQFLLGPEELLQAQIPPALEKAIDVASARIRAFAELQMPQPFVREIAPGLTVGQIVRPLDTIATYIPAGRYPLVSTLLMTVIPAQVAGVKNICLATPKPAPTILGAARRLGTNRLFLLGGAHAIAAFAFGTETIPRADRIVGPGNVYVAAAKKRLAGEVAIDFVAGPTEIVIIAEEGDASVIAADMLAQAEHDQDASAILLTTSRALAERVAEEIEKQLAHLPTHGTARAAIEQNSAIVLCRSNTSAVAWSNAFAPEHLSLHDDALLSQIENAGSIFLGAMSPEAAGDYASGPNHVLPTGGMARLRGGLSVADFVKVITTQQLTPGALRALAPAVTTLARAEGLEAHARSLEVRTNA